MKLDWNTLSTNWILRYVLFLNELVFTYEFIHQKNKESQQEQSTHYYLSCGELKAPSFRLNGWRGEETKIQNSKFKDGFRGIAFKNYR